MKRQGLSYEALPLQWLVGSDGLLHLHTELVHDEAIDVGRLFHLLAQWFATAMSSLAIDADEHGCVAALTLL